MANKEIRKEQAKPRSGVTNRPKRNFQTAWQRKKPTKDDLMRKNIKKEIMQKKAMAKQQKVEEAKAERERCQREKEERIKKYKKKRLEKTKVISKRTQRGQPLMKDRMQLLLKQIEEIKRSLLPAAFARKR